MSNRKILLAFATLLLAFSFLGCKKKKKSVEQLQNAIITGYDYRKCFCCGGLLINFRDNINSFDGEYRLVSNDPATLGITDSTQFPVYMKVAWAIDSSKCLGSYIKILKYEKR